jgi:hypothetical protein
MCQVMMDAVLYPASMGARSLLECTVYTCRMVVKLDQRPSVDGRDHQRIKHRLSTGLENQCFRSVGCCYKRPAVAISNLCAGSPPLSVIFVQVYRTFLFLYTLFYRPRQMFFKSYLFVFLLSAFVANAAVIAVRKQDEGQYFLPSLFAPVLRCFFLK